MAKRVAFVSYDHADAAYANRLLTWFQDSERVNERLKAWIYSESIPPGTNWRQEIEHAIRSCNVFLIIASEAHFSRYVLFEIGMAIGMKKRIIPFYTDSPQALVPYFLDQLQGKLFPTGDADLTQLLRMVISQSDGPSLELAISEWLDAKARKSGSLKTVLAYRYTIDAFRQMLQGVNLDLDSDAQAVTLAAEAWAFHGTDGVSPVSGQTTNQRLAIVSSFYIFGAKQLLLVDANGAALPNPISRIERVHVQPYTSARPLSAETVNERLAAIDRSTLFGKRDYALLALALQTGRRASELCMLSVGDLEVDHGRLTVTWRRTRGGKVLYDALADGPRDALLDWLSSYYLDAPSKDAPVFVSLSRRNRGGRLTYQGISDIYAHRLGTGKVATTRHTLAHEMDVMGARVSEIQRQLGHTDMSSTGLYLGGMASEENPYASQIAQRLGLRASNELRQ